MATKGPYDLEIEKKECLFEELYNTVVKDYILDDLL